MDRATSPEERRAGLARMKQTLISARMGLDDLRAALTTTRERLAGERAQLDTMRRRRALAAGIADQETVALATKYEGQHAERVSVLERKLEAQEAELAIAERDVAAMTGELRSAMARMGGSAAAATENEPRPAHAAVEESRGVQDEIDAIDRAAARTAREVDAERLLAELKRRMGK